MKLRSPPRRPREIGPGGPGLVAGIAPEHLIASQRPRAYRPATPGPGPGPGGWARRGWTGARDRARRAARGGVPARCRPRPNRPPGRRRRPRRQTAGATRSTNRESLTLAMPRAVPTVIRPWRDATAYTRLSGNPRPASTRSIRPSRVSNRATPKSVAAQMPVPCPARSRIWVNGMPDAGRPLRVRKDLSSGSTRVSAASANWVRCVAAHTPSGAPSTAPTTADGKPKLSRSGMAAPSRRYMHAEAGRPQIPSLVVEAPGGGGVPHAAKVGIEQNLGGVGLQRGTAPEHLIHRRGSHRTRRSPAGRGHQAPARDDQPSAAGAEEQAGHRIARIEGQVDDSVRHGPAVPQLQLGLVVNPAVGPDEPERVVERIDQRPEDARQQRRIGRIVRALPLLELRLPEQHASPAR